MKAIDEVSLQLGELTQCRSLKRGWEHFSINGIVYAL